MNSDSGFGPHLVRESLLLVDDDDTFRIRLARAFEDRGFDVRTAANYDEAIVAATQDSPEHAVLDLKMPGKSGLELLKALLEIDQTTRVLLLTGYGSIATAVDAMRLGAVNYLAKPADVEEILAGLRKLQGEESAAISDEEIQAPSLARVEWEHINRVLSDCDGNISKAARRLGIHRRSLQRKLARYAPD